MTGSFMQWLVTENGIVAPRVLPDGRWAGIYCFAFSSAIMVGQVGDPFCHDDRWCYHELAAAKAALEAWDGVGEPAGWYRHPGSGRRVSESAEERDEAGNEVGAVGVVYRRW